MDFGIKANSQIHVLIHAATFGVVKSGHGSLSYSAESEV